MTVQALCALIAASEMAAPPAPAPPPFEPSAWYALQTDDAGVGAAGVQLSAGYEGRLSGLSLSARYVRTAYDDYAPADITLTWTRDLDTRRRLGVSLWQGLNRAGGGLGAAVSFRMTLGRPAALAPH